MRTQFAIASAARTACSWFAAQFTIVHSVAGAASIARRASSSVTSIGSALSTVSNKSVSFSFILTFRFYCGVIAALAPSSARGESENLNHRPTGADKLLSEPDH